MEHGECRALFDLAFDRDSATHFFDDSVADREPEPGSLTDRFGGEERIEDPAEIRLWYPLARVLHLENDLVSDATCVVTVTVPPGRSMASMALLTRLRRTCWSSEGEAWMVGRSGLSSVSMWTLA